MRNTAFLQLPGRICFPATGVIPLRLRLFLCLFFVPSFIIFLHSQTFDREKYTHLRADAPNNNNNNASNGKDKTLVGLRIDDKGGIYLQVKLSSLATCIMFRFQAIKNGQCRLQSYSCDMLG